MLLWSAYTSTCNSTPGVPREPGSSEAGAAVRTLDVDKAGGALQVLLSRSHGKS